MGRLFWKLFLCFWLGMVLSFVVGAAWVRLAADADAGRREAGREAALMLATAETLLEHGDLPALVPALAAWNARPHGPRLGVLAGDDSRLVAGVATPEGQGTRRAVPGARGTRYVLATDVAAVEGDERPPSVGIPVTSGAAVAFLLSYVLAWYLSHPLQTVRWALHEVARGRFATRIGPRMGGRRDEIVDLAHDFDRMAGQLQGIIEGRQRFLHDISHELRSPLTRLQAALGLLRQDPGRLEAMSARLEREAERMDTLVEDLLTLARLEEGDSGPGRERVDLIDLLAAIVDDAAFEAEAMGRAVVLEAPGRFVSTVNGTMICRAFENVIRNAVRFTPLGTTVRVRAWCPAGGGWLHVDVEDEGPGVPPDQMDRIFEPFVRLEGDRPHPGGGLGLAIARRAIESHGGRIHAEPGPSGGLRVRLSLPAG
ncbi:HAMP domain-containing sensor histidine kinase [Pararhodospirillum oryzae]|uniref:histidine kinase n=1 Tax=Pararhodospirillum oryzae TaxID=478448 RepID=A0A512HB09_9PROT|nr:ATP-binding protein [Pararhodospirillum oryzae]GEO82632.1 two-component sensor histidine kinase [Pararhodospirillum oryzae]